MTMTDTEIIDWLETAAKRSHTGISFDWIPSVDGEPSGFRFMRKHFIGEPRTTLRAAVRAARDQMEGKPLDLPMREPTTWQPMDTAPLDGTHCILAVQEGAFIWSVQGVYRDGEWDCVYRSNVKPLAWMPNVLLPDWAKPWTPSDTNHACTPLQDQYTLDDVHASTEPVTVRDRIEAFEREIDGS